MFSVIFRLAPLLRGVGSQTMDQLYDAAEAAHLTFKGMLLRVAVAMGAGVTTSMPELKDRQRAEEKCANDYAGVVAMLRDIVRGSLVCDPSVDISELFRLVETDDAVAEIVKFKNRFAQPTANGFFDVNCQVKIQLGDGHTHLCEVQIHASAAAEYKLSSGSHNFYKYWRAYFKGSENALRARLADLAKIVDDAFLAGADAAVGEEEASSAAQRAMAEALVRSVFASRDAARLDALTLAFSIHVQQPELALVLYRRLLAVEVAEHGLRHAKVAAAHMYIGMVLDDRGDYPAALTCFAEARDVYAEACGPRSKEVATVLNNTGVAQRNQSDFAAARASYEEALAIQVEVLGPRHEHVGRAHNNIGIVLEKQGDLDGALTSYGQALDIKAEALGSDHPSVAGTHQNMANVFRLQGKLGEAREGFDKALAIKVQAQGPDHTSVANTHVGLGDLARDAGDNGTARAKYTEAHRIYSAALGPGHRQTQQAVRQLAELEGK